MEDAGTQAVEAGKEEVASGTLSAWGTVAILTTLYCFGSLDRQMISLLVEPIKRDLGFTDMEIGLLQGAAFALFFVAASLPVGWMIDRFSRRLIIFWGTIAWSLSAAASGLAQTFPQMFAARAGVGAGESTLQPAAFAIMADIFPPAKLSLPLSVFVIGANLGSGMSLIVGGAVINWIAQGPRIVLPVVGHLAPWEMGFILTGLPSLALAFLIFLVPERKRMRLPQQATAQSDFTALFCRYRQHARFYICHHGAFAMCIAFFMGLLAWNPAFIQRAYHWDTGRIGLWLGLTQIGTATLALSFHGWFVDRLFRSDIRDVHLRYFIVLAPLAGIAGAGAYMVSSPWHTIALFNVSLFLLMGYPGIGAAALQITTPAGMRGKASAIYLITLNLVGATLGPLVIAAITDKVFQDESMLGHSMSLFSLGAMGIATLLFVLGRSGMPRALVD